MRTVARCASGALVLVMAAGCQSASNPAPQTGATPHAESLLACAERELFSRGYRVRHVPGNRMRLWAEQTLAALTPRRAIIMVEYDPETQGLDVWGQVRRTTVGAMDPSAEVTLIAWAVEDACTRKDAPHDQSKQGSSGK